MRQSTFPDFKLVGLPERRCGSRLRCLWIASGSKCIYTYICIYFSRPLKYAHVVSKHSGMPT